MAVAGVVLVSDTPVTRAVRKELAKAVGVGQTRIAQALMVHETAPELGDEKPGPVTISPPDHFAL